MKEEFGVKYLVHYRWYYVANYLVALGEQIALWAYGYHTFFWFALGLNIIGVIGVGNRLSKLEKQCGFDW